MSSQTSTSPSMVDSFHEVKAQKAGVLLWCYHVRSITKLFRLIELCLALVLLSWIFSWLPIAVRISSEFFRRLAGVIASPTFVFLLCNAIIATLLVKSGKFSGEIPAVDNADTELYEHLLTNNENRPSKSLSENISPPPTHVSDEVVYQDKQIISQVNTTTPTGEDDQDVVEMEFSSDSESDSGNQRFHRRSKSEKLQRNYAEKVKERKLRRSETDKYMNAVKSGGGVGGDGDGLCAEDELSDAEFQRAVDEFIAKHLRFRHQESVYWASEQ